jgi:hypothetical protein
MKDLREFVEKIVNEVLKEENVINEGVDQCEIEDLYNSVSKYIDKDLPSIGKQIKSEIIRYGIGGSKSYISITFNYKIEEYTYYNLDDNTILKQLKESMLTFRNYFNKFKDFCQKGVRGLASTFNKNTSRVIINSSFKLDIVKKNKDKKYVYRYNDSGLSEISTSVDEYKKRYGNEDLNTVFIEVGLFIRNI